MYVMMPTNWGPANISFQASPDNALFGDICTEDGREVILPCIPASAVQIPPGLTAAKGSWLKIRSGSRNYPVVQTEDQEFIIVVSN